MLRRVILVLIAIYVHEAPWIQAILFIMTSGLVCVYLVSVIPFESRAQNKLEIANELMILFTGYCTAISVGWNMPAGHRFYVGLITIFFIAAVILFNVARWLTFMIKYAKMHHRGFINRRRRAMQVHDRKDAGEHAKANQKEMNLVSVETERGLMATVRKERGMDKALGVGEDSLRRVQLAELPDTRKRRAPSGKQESASQMTSILELSSQDMSAHEIEGP